MTFLEWMQERDSTIYDDYSMCEKYSSSELDYLWQDYDIEHPDEE
jgi:hypothetical protein